MSVLNKAPQTPTIIIVTYYDAPDGCRFTTYDACDAYMQVKSKLDVVMTEMPKLVKDLGHNEYLQHNIHSFIHLRNKFLNILMQHYDFGSVKHWVEDTINKEGIHISYSARAIDEMCPSGINRLYYRFQCVDAQGREWQQIYYANNTPKDPVCLNA